MPTYEVTSPDGKTWEVNAPDGATQDQVLAYAKQQWTAQVKPIPAAVQAGSALGDIPRQLGLTARYGLEGLAQAAQIGTEPIRQLLLGGRGKPLAQEASSLADVIGLPKPSGANERVVADASRLVAGAGGLGAAGRAAQSAPGVLGQLGGMLSANMPQQIGSAAGAGLAGGSVREAGGGPGAEALAGLVGGVGGGLAATAIPAAGRSVAGAARTMLGRDPVRPEVVEQRIELALRGSGVNWREVPERIKQGMRAEVAQALQTGDDLSGDALRRLLAFRTVPGTTPTRGMLTQDPVQITREMNLAKTGANSTDIGLQRLPGLQSQNTVALLDALDNAGARNAPDAYATGARVLGALRGNAAASKARIDSLYERARDTSGRAAELDGAAFTSAANKALDEGLLGGALPPDVARHMNDIAQGKVPFNVDYAEQLKTAIGKLQRASSDGATRMALGKVREALDSTPLRASPQVNPGNLPAVPGTVPPSVAAMGEESIAAFNRARSANRAFMQRVESTPALKAAMDGAEPDKFVQQFITGQGATVADVRALQRATANNPQALQAVKSNIVAHLKSAATNGTEDVAKFSPASYSRALNNIGDRKLSAFFSPEEITQLRAIGQVGTLMKAQPDGSAVNNSNSGALLIGRALTALDAISGKLPLGLDTMVQGVMRGTQQSKALSVPQSLLLQNTPKRGLLDYAGPAAMYGGLLATQPVD